MTAIDISTLSAADLAKLLAQAPKVEKETKAKAASLPAFAYVMVMTDSKLVYWSGKADDDLAAQQAAIAYAEKDGGKVFASGDSVAICPRPLPAPRGRKAAPAKES